MCETGLNWAVLGSVLFGLLMFGVAYNALIHYLGRRKSGYVSLFVVGGVLVTAGGIAIIDWRAALIMLACFAASGLPMVIGEMYRTVAERERESQRNWLEIEEHARKILNRDDQA